MTPDWHVDAALLGTERMACILRLAVGGVLLVMTVQFEPVASWLAVTAIVTAVGWSVLMAIALRSGLDASHLKRLATWSHWFDVTLALAVYAMFLPDPVATPVAAVPLLAFRLALRYGTAGVVTGGAAFVGLIAFRILFVRLTVGEWLARPPMLMAWTLVATVTLVLAYEARARSTGGTPESGRRGPVPQPTLSVAPVGTPGTGDERLDSLAACLSLKLETPDSAKLTQREIEVLLLLGQGHSYSGIASRLFISQSTVRNHMHNIRAKLDVHDRDEILRVAKALAARNQAQATPRDDGESDRVASVG